MKLRSLKVTLPHFFMFGVPTAVGAIAVVLPLMAHAVPACVSGVFTVGSTGKCVSYIQSLSNYATGLVNIPDGQFGPATANVVRVAQTRFGLPASGNVDAATWKILCDPRVVPTPLSFPVADAKAAGCSVKVTTCTSIIYGQGSSGTCVSYIQALINYANDVKTAVDGKYGPGTAASVRSAQAKYNLVQDGIVSVATWKAICSPRINPVPDNFPLVEARSAGCTLPTNVTMTTARQLAQQIINNKKVISFQTDAGRRAMEYIAATGFGRDCGAPPISTKLLNAIILASKKYKLVMGVIVDGHDCIGGFHPKGMAVDINGVATLDGKQSTGTAIPMNSKGTKFALSAAKESLLKKFYVDMAKILATTGGGMGQQQCFNGTAPAKTKGVTTFNDSCDHLHIDVGTR